MGIFSPYTHECAELFEKSVKLYPVRQSCSPIKSGFCLKSNKNPLYSDPATLFPLIIFYGLDIKTPAGAISLCKSKFDDFVFTTRLLIS